MQQYLDLMRDVLDNGEVKQQRAVLQSTGERPTCRSLFGRQVRYDLAQGFPLVTTKRIPFKQVVHELLWFLSGSTNSKELREKGVRIWSQWEDEAGDIGPAYGRTWRYWTQYADVDEFRCDQIGTLIDNIKKIREDPNHQSARRLILSAWNAPEISHYYEQGGKSPLACHTMSQFSLQEDGTKLSCQMYQRSADLFLGGPFNIACYAILTHLLACVCNVPKVGEFIHTFGDVHIYSNHEETCREQLTRIPHGLPNLVLSGDFSDIDKVTAEQFELVDYNPYPSLKGEVAV